MEHIAVVGASLAGLQAAVAMRRGGYDGRISLVGDEPHYPYDRPPLSKGYLAGATDTAALRLRPAADPAETGVDWVLGRRAVGLEWDMDAGGGTIRLDDDEPLTVDGMVITTGAAARTLPMAEGVDGVHVLRSLDDADGLRAAFTAGPDRVVVVGCGFIGAEVAATAREAGLEVTIVEAAPSPLARVLDHQAGMAVADLHRSHGVEVRLGVGVAGLTTLDGAVTAVELADGSSIPATLVVIGIGVTPNTGWLDGSGLRVDDGVVVDETCVAAPGVVAAGDVARWPHRRYGGRLMRIEQWDNAVEMGRYAGQRLLAIAEGDNAETPAPFEPVPWFWSDQYDRKMQLAGVVGTAQEMLQGTFDEGRFVQLHLDDDGVPTGSFCWNRPRQAIMTRQLLAAGAPVEEFREKLS
ncbi:MAG: FAD-dependent oxidoreductase [Actinomycetota bacterium]